MASKKPKHDLEHIYPIIQIPSPLPGEKWEFISDKIIPEVYPYYYAVSTYGRVVQTRDKLLLQSAWDGGGYRIVILQTYTGTVTCRIHRLIMLTFRYFEGCEKFVIDHINGNKSMNYIDFPVYNTYTGMYELQDNLEWVTQSENEKRAFKMGLKKPSYHLRTLTDDQVIKICELIQENKLTYQEIANKLEISQNIVDNIAHHPDQMYKDITKNYTFERRVPTYLDESKVREVCELLEKHFSLKDTSEITGVNYNTVKHIRQKRVWASISKDYDI